jgi:hypothetical protein
MKKWSVFIACLWAIQASAQSTYPAAGCGAAQIQAAINSELVTPANGDIISVPAGSCTWTGTQQVSATFTTSVTIQGAGAISSTTGGASTTGADQTAITDELTNSGASMIVLAANSPNSLRITGIALLNDDSGLGTSAVLLYIGGTSTALRVDHCHLNVNNQGLYVDGSLNGVADHDYFTSDSGSLTNDVAFHNGQGWNGTSGSNSFGSFADTEHWGSSEFFFVEDSQFYNGSVSDAHDGARYVFRHNTVTGTGASAQQMYWHGVTPDPVAGGRAAEVYDNNFIQAGNNSNPTASLNSGTMLYWGNTVTGGWGNALQIAYNSRTTPVGTGGNVNYNYSATPNGWGYCGTAAGGPTNWDSNTNSASGYACIMQPGRGAGDLLTGSAFPNIVNSTTGTIAWPHEALSPIYVWNNTWTPQYYTSNSLIGNQVGGSAGALVSDNEEYFQQFGSLAESGSFSGKVGVGQGSLPPTNSSAYTNAPNCTAGTDPVTSGVAPGVGYWDTTNNTLYVCTATNTWTAYYTPYTYPNPLTNGSNPSPPPTPAPPTNLTATVQ